jgi:NAD dependent epimerase/dehydratase family enzyme
VVNIVSPEPIHNREFMKALRISKNIPFGIPVGILLLKLGAKIIGTETELVLKSRNVIPKRLQENGFKFIYGDIYKALHRL